MCLTPRLLRLPVRVGCAQEIDASHTFAGALTGFVVGLTGVGGGALMTPILLIFFGVSPTTAIATDLWFAAVTKTGGAVAHHRHGHVDYRITGLLLQPTYWK